MLENGKISPIQFSVLVTMYLIGSSILLLPSALAAKARQDAWLAAIIGVGLGFLLVMLYNALAGYYPKMNLSEYSEKILGKWLGIIVSLFFSGYFFLISSLVLRNIGDFLVTHMLGETPIQIVEILILLVVIIGLYYGLESFGRTSEILFPITIIFFSLLVLLVLPLIKIEHLQPMLENGIKPIINGTLPYMGTPCMELVVFLMIYPYVTEEKKAKKAFYIGYLIGGIVLIIISLVTVLVMGPGLTAAVIYPTFLLATKINVGDFLQRIEAVMAILWFITIFFKLIICFYATTACFAHSIKLKKSRILYFPFGMMMIVLSLIAYPNSSYFVSVIGSIWMPYASVYGLLLPILLLVVGKLRGVSAQEG
ncbi:endospore germination permease [Bacillus sp. DNRA2]|uniref:GerAB/ArcD/ProY family transporter n=1 Tax=Bacillus sp. DNRA2 TaxID=2723053 RepID=UPI00145DA68D|nr:endospore germination permease [Bacillus sp. DNRA2]NMD68728.1 endospore germination permease [Bacillus sp. DNRA2]